MLSVSRIRGASRAAAYYGRDDYYVTGEADAPGLEWGGKGAEQLGLRGAARAGEFKAVLGGRNPDPQGPPISSAGKAKAHHPGWDFTFSAPKSVSVAILVGGDARLSLSSPGLHRTEAAPAPRAKASGGAALTSTPSRS